MSRGSGGAADLLGVLLVALTGALSGLIEVLLVPLYVGSVPIPVTVVLAVATNWLLPRLARAFVASTPAAAAPFATWLVVVIGFGAVTRPEGDVILPGGSLQWVTYGLVLAGGLAGAVSVFSSAGPRASRRPTQRR